MSEQTFDEFAQDGGAAEFTLTLGNVIAMGYNTPEKLHLDSAHYPIFDESYRAKLNRKIVQHYALREIGSETVEQFVFYLGRNMCEGMDYFNQLYKSQAEKIDWLSTTLMDNESNSNDVAQSSSKSSSTQHNESKGKSDSQSDNHTKAQSVNNELPQTATEGDYRNYATSSNVTDSDVTGTSHGTSESSSDSTANSSTDFSHSDNTGNATAHTQGYSGMSPSQLLQQYRDTMLNIDNMVIDSLDRCFMGVWGGGDNMRSPQLGVYYPNIGRF